MQQGIQLHWSGYRHPQTQGKVDAFTVRCSARKLRRGVPDQQRQQWLDEYRHEYNQVRPHEALEMQTPASGGDGARAPITRTLHLGNTRKARRW